ncbi:hypothetical protein [Plasmodium yoelii yoelii]|uniref:Uncharacterized protein n=1 Tax=Plasmodium yoelii yoelii TaxID=73239 RepID=Q7REE6_PLAYO|nr:hypothetical protein [Plasmodium yoelii yoelii]
MQYPNCLLYKP